MGEFKRPSKKFLFEGVSFRSIELCIGGIIE